ncbi:MFS transporter [Saccharomonospora piscinae]|uniref:MFS transporter n=1 Tax=Saccharomonospora piscinae TaxID=687388 RepID=UPI000465D6D1|nr:MFS transporter [Saccharomonospora piscinae]
MTGSRVPTEVPAPTVEGRRRALAALCVTQITSWGVLYYAFPVLLTEISTATGWSLPWLTAALTASQLVSALVGIPVGRWLDRYGPRVVMTTGSVLAVGSLIAVALAPSLAWFVTAWAVAGIAMGAVLYPPAFAALTRWYGPDRVRALTMVTLAGGLASTVFAPLTAVLSAHLDWRGTYLALAAILGVLTVPAHWFGLRLPWPPAPRPGARHHSADPARVARSRPFLALVVSLSVAAFATFAVVIHLVPLLAERGIGTATAAVALGLGGAGQVAGRLGYAALTRRTTVRARTAGILLAMAVTTALLGVFTTVAALVVAAVVAGMARGMFTLVQATAVTERWGSTHYGRLTGLLSAPLTVTMALAPLAGAALAELLGGYAVTFVLLGALTVAASVLSLASVPTTSATAATR